MTRHTLLWLAACALVAGCATAPKAPPRGGGYYQNDGPPAQVPADLAGVPDAIPRVEPLNPFANRPYVALGRTYTPLNGDAPFRQRGLASWYGRQFHGNRTSSGEIYDMFAMTAAHPTLPIPSYVRVTRIRTGASVIVRVNDRGPFKDDRIIDLSYAAASRLGFADVGTAEVEIERLTNADIASGR
ncbi:MAG: septal ring lytic transglycosylase RlpA family protein, partial [Gemmatimonadota bacterium]